MAHPETCLRVVCAPVFSIFNISQEFNTSIKSQCSQVLYTSI
jgi:hypothetical protein